LYRKHLDGGIKKGALTAEQAEAKFTQWLEAKGGKIEGKKEGLTSSKEEARKTALAAETKKNTDRGAALAIKNAPVEEVVEEPAADEAADATDATETPAEGTTEENNA
jgi:small subunit ribosomal protein S16